MSLNERLIEPGEVAVQAGLPNPTPVYPRGQAIFRTSMVPKVTQAPHLDLLKRQELGALIGWTGNGNGFAPYFCDASESWNPSYGYGQCCGEIDDCGIPFTACSGSTMKAINGVNSVCNPGSSCVTYSYLQTLGASVYTPWYLCGEGPAYTIYDKSPIPSYASSTTVRVKVSSSTYSVVLGVSAITNSHPVATEAAHNIPVNFSSSTMHWSPGAITGLIIASAFALVVIVMLGLCIARRRSQKKQPRRKLRLDNLPAANYWADSRHSSNYALVEQPSPRLSALYTQEREGLSTQSVVPDEPPPAYRSGIAVKDKLRFARDYHWG